MKIVRDQPENQEMQHPVRRSIFSDFIDDKEANLKPLYESRDYMAKVEGLIDPELLTPEVKAFIKARAQRIDEYILKMEREREELVEAHHAELAAGRILELKLIDKK